MDKLRILLADDHAVVREGLKSLINAQPDMEVVGEASNGLEVAEQVRDLVLGSDITIDLRFAHQMARFAGGEVWSVRSEREFIAVRQENTASKNLRTIAHRCRTRDRQAIPDAD